MSTPDREPPGRRQQRELAESLSSVRPRVAEDLHDADVPVAATVVIARDGTQGIEVLMIRRPERGSFAGAWVFPGGKFEAADADDLPADAPEGDIARRAGVRETFEETGLILDPEELVTLSRWDPPPGLPLRIRTWFFVAGTSTGVISLSPDEAVEALWVRPGDMLERHGRGEVTLYPPTWITLHGIGAADVAALQAEARLAGPQTFATQARRGPSGPMFYWSEDAEYEVDAADAAAAASGPRHRLEAGALPWVYTRSG